MFLSVLFSLLFSSSFCRRLRRVRRSRPPPTCPRRLCAVFFHFAFSYSGRRRHRGRRGHASDQSNLVTGKKERDTAVQDFCLFFSPSFPLPCGSIYLSIISSIRLFCQSQIFAHFHGNHRLPGCFLLLS